MRYNSIKDLMKRYGMSEGYWRQQIFEKNIEYVKIGKAVRVTDDVASEHLASKAILINKRK